jgi:SAM-dependent methyltransferase
MNLINHAQHVADFLGINYQAALERIQKGFHYNHAEVARDFLSKNVNVNDSAALLDWYRKTDSYIWELSAYHLEPGFNYGGMCDGIAIGLKNSNKENVLSIGDGIGTLSIRLAQEGLSANYNDLRESRTANFAQYRFAKYKDLKISTSLTNNFNPTLEENKYDAVVALDFFEHVVNVDEWATAVYHCLKTSGVFIAQNAFGIGDFEHGNSIPMHLSINNKYQTEWPTLLASIGFVLHSNNQWWVKP